MAPRNHVKDPTHYHARVNLGELEPDIDERREGFCELDTQGEPLTTIYAVLDTQAAQVKVGITGNIDRRLRQLSQQRGRPLEILATIRGTLDLERSLHRRFRNYRAPGQQREWYSTEIVGELATIFSA